MKLQNSLLVAASMAAVMSSCIEPTENTHKESQGYYMLNYVTDGTNERYSIGTATITIETMQPSGSDIIIKNVEMSTGSSSSFSANNLEEKNVESGMQFNITSSSISSMTDPKITLLGGTNRLVDWNLFYKFNSGNDKVIGMPAASFYFSTTTTSGPDGGPIFSTEALDKNVYCVEINKEDINTSKRTLNIYIKAASFLRDMPTTNMVMTDVPFSIADGRLKIDVDNIYPKVPQVVNSEQKLVEDKNYPITNLHVSGIIGEEFIIAFNCAPIIKDVPEMTYSISSLLRFRFKTPDTDKNKPQN